MKLQPKSLEAHTLRRVCLHMSPAHLAEAKRLSGVIKSDDGRRMTASAIVREALEHGLEVLNRKGTVSGSGR